MARRVLEVTLISAKDLKKVTLFSKMRVYAVASISGGDPRVPTHRTHADREGGRSPMWHAPLRFPIPPAADADTRAMALHVLLRAERAFGDSDVGEVFVPVQDLVAAVPGDGEHRHVSYHVRRPVSGRKCGVLHISYQITDEVPEPASAAAGPRGASSRYAHGASTRHASAKGLHAITAYPSAGRNSGGRRGAAYSPTLAYHHGSPYGGGGGGHAQHHHHHHHHYGYGAVGPSYGYNPAPYGHGAAAAAASQGGGTGMGAGLGVGVVGGAVAGMVLADMFADGEMDASLDAGMGC